MPLIQAEHPSESFIVASAAEMHGRLRQWAEARRLAARAVELAPADARPLQVCHPYKSSTARLRSHGVRTFQHGLLTPALALYSSAVCEDLRRCIVMQG